METEIKLARMEERQSSLETKVDKIMDNHLPHMQEKLEKIDSKIAYWTGGVGVAIALLNIILGFLK